MSLDIVILYTCALGMCISITEADAIRISMHSQRYDTLKIHEAASDAIRYDTPLLQCSAIRFRFDSTRFDAV